MPFPVAHSLIGASVGAAIERRSEAFWQILLLSALLGVCPDFDYVLNWLRTGVEVDITGLHIRWCSRCLSVRLQL